MEKINDGKRLMSFIFSVFWKGDRIIGNGGSELADFGKEEN